MTSAQATPLVKVERPIARWWLVVCLAITLFSLGSVALLVELVASRVNEAIGSLVQHLPDPSPPARAEKVQESQRPATYQAVSALAASRAEAGKVAPKTSNASPEVSNVAPKSIATPAVPLLEVPLNAPSCEGIYAYIITTFEDSAHSVATLSTDPKSQGSLRRIGQKYGDYQVVRIDYNRRYLSSAVWLEANAEVCQVLLRDEHPVRERLIARATNARQKKQRREQKRRRKNKLRRKKR